MVLKNPENKLAAKIIRLRQRRNLSILLDGAAGELLNDKVIDVRYFPDSSVTLEAALKIINSEETKKSIFFDDAIDLMLADTLAAVDLLAMEKSLLCFFFNYSHTDEGIVSELPLLVVDGAVVRECLNYSLKEKAFSFFLCTSADLTQGTVLDASAGDPEISGSDAPIYELYRWGKSLN